MADPAHLKRGIINKILRRPAQGTPTAATPDELISDADLASIPEDYVDDGMVPILGQYVPPEGGPAFDPMGTAGIGSADYSATEDFQATPTDRAAEGEGIDRVTGRIISRGEAPESAVAMPEGDPYAGEWWNDPDIYDTPPTVDQAAAEAVGEATIDLTKPMSWGGGGGWNYQNVLDPDTGNMTAIMATSPDGRVIKVTPDNPAYAAIITELYREGPQPLSTPEAPAPEPAPAPELEVMPSPESYEAAGAEQMGYGAAEPYGEAPDMGYDFLSEFDAVTGGKYGESSVEPAQGSVLEADYPLAQTEAAQTMRQGWEDPNVEAFQESPLGALKSGMRRQWQDDPVRKWLRGE